MKSVWWLKKKEKVFSLSWFVVQLQQQRPLFFFFFLNIFFFFYYFGHACHMRTISLSLTREAEGEFTRTLLITSNSAEAETGRLLLWHFLICSDPQGLVSTLWGPPLPPPRIAQARSTLMWCDVIRWACVRACVRVCVCLLCVVVVVCFLFCFITKIIVECWDKIIYVRC